MEKAASSSKDVKKAVAGTGGVTMVSEEQINQMSSGELKRLVKKQQQVIIEQERKYEQIKKRSMSRPKTANKQPEVQVQ